MTKAEGGRMKAEGRRMQAEGGTRKAASSLHPSSFTLHPFEAGYSTMYWALFIGFVLIPMPAFAIELGRYFYVRGEMYKAADAAALAASIEVDPAAFRQSGRMVFTGRAPAYAQLYANLNADYLTANGIHPRVTGMDIDQARREVTVELSADVSRLFPSVTPWKLITGIGTAEVRSQAISFRQ